MPAELLSGVELVVAVLGVLSVFAGVFIWLVRRSQLLATEPYVEGEVKEVDTELHAEMSDIRDTMSEMRDHVDKNQQEMENLRSLIEGGNSQWEDGVLDYLQRNIERVDEISDDIEKVQEHLDDMNNDT